MIRKKCYRTKNTREMKVLRIFRTRRTTGHENAKERSILLSQWAFISRFEKQRVVVIFSISNNKLNWAIFRYFTQIEFARLQSILNSLKEFLRWANRVWFICNIRFEIVLKLVKTVTIRCTIQRLPLEFPILRFCEMELENTYTAPSQRCVYPICLIGEILKLQKIW